MPPLYNYTPLDEASQNIRLLTLLPGIFRDPIRIYLKVEHLSRENIPEFEALSYAWGAADDLGEIKVKYASDSNAQSVTDKLVNAFHRLHFEPGLDRLSYGMLSVTANLEEALRHLRFKTKRRRLWIDAICINQKDVLERNAQVRRMADIYSLARRVVVWLGPERGDSALGMKLLKTLGGKIDVSWPSTMTAASEDRSEQHWADKTAILPYSQREVDAIAEILMRPWFERLWIWQEIWLAGPLAILICGSQSILWSIFRKTGYAIKNKPLAYWPSTNPDDFGLRKDFVGYLCQMLNYRYLSFMLIITKNSKCSDPRDRIFALLSLLDHKDKAKSIKADYNKSVSEVYQDAFLHVCKGNHNLYLMVGCELGDEVSDIPTWVPNWSVPLRSGQLINNHAAAGSLPDFQLTTNKRFRVCGVHVETVKSVSQHNFPIKYQTYQDISAGLRELALGCNLQPSQYGEFTRVILCDGFIDGYFLPGTLLSDAPRRDEAISILSDTLRDSESSLCLTPRKERCLTFMKDYLTGRSVYTASDGSLGLGPSFTQPGDIIVVFLGMPTCMALRPVTGNVYKVVGAAYHHGYTHGEALLGTLPNSHRLLWQEVQNGVSDARYQEIATGIVGVEDPRIEKLLQDCHIDDESPDFLQFEETKTTIRRRNRAGIPIPAKELEFLGVELQTFDLI